MIPKVKIGNRISQGLSLPLKGLVHVYRRLISPLLPPSCRYEPTCSQYALEALELHGPLKGTWLTVRRLSHCHPFTWLGGGSGFDPVPHRCAHDHDVEPSPSTNTHNKIA